MTPSNASRLVARGILRRVLGVACAALGILALLGHLGAASAHAIEWSVGLAFFVIGALVALGRAEQGATHAVTALCAALCVGAATFHAVSTWTAAPVHCGCIRSAPAESVGHGAYMTVLGVLALVAVHVLRPALHADRRVRTVLGVGIVIAAGLGTWVALAWQVDGGGGSAVPSPLVPVPEVPSLGTPSHPRTAPSASPTATLGAAAVRKLVVELVHPGPGSLVSEGVRADLSALRGTGAVVLQGTVRVPAGRSIHAFDVPGSGAPPDRVVVDVDGLPSTGASVTWENDIHGASVGRCRLAWVLARTRYEGRVLDPEAQPIAGLRLLVTTADRRTQVGTTARRAALQAEGRANAVVVTTGADGSFVARGLLPGALQAHSLDPGYEALPGQRGRRADLGTIDEAASPAPATLTFARVFELALCVRLATPSTSVPLDANPWGTVEALMVPTFPGRSKAPLPQLGGAPDPHRRPGTRVLARQLSLERADWRPTSSYVGRVEAACPGYRTEVAEVTWRAVGDPGTDPVVVLEPRATGAAARVELELTNAPGFLDEARFFAWLREHGSAEDGVRGDAFRSAVRVEGRRAIVAEALRPGTYEVSSAVFTEPVILKIPSGRSPSEEPIVARAECVPLAAVRARVEDEEGRPILSYAMQLSPSGPMLRGRVQGSTRTAGLPNATTGVRCVGMVARNGARCYLLVDPPEAVRLQAYAQGRGYVADDALLTPGEATRLTLKFR